MPSTSAAPPTCHRRPPTKTSLGDYAWMIGSCQEVSLLIIICQEPDYSCRECSTSFLRGGCYYVYCILRYIYIFIHMSVPPPQLQIATNWGTSDQFGGGQPHLRSHCSTQGLAVGMQGKSSGNGSNLKGSLKYHIEQT